MAKAKTANEPCTGGFWKMGPKCCVQTSNTWIGHGAGNNSWELHPCSNFLMADTQGERHKPVLKTPIWPLLRWSRGAQTIFPLWRCLSWPAQHVKGRLKRWCRDKCQCERHFPLPPGWQVCPVLLKLSPSKGFNHTYKDVQAIPDCLPQCIMI